MLSFFSGPGLHICNSAYSGRTKHLATQPPIRHRGCPEVEVASALPEKHTPAGGPMGTFPVMTMRVPGGNWRSRGWVGLSRNPQNARVELETRHPQTGIRPSRTGALMPMEPVPLLGLGPR
jgi:hypothetical protein